MCYGINPPDLTEIFYGCGTVFDIFHDLYCKKGGLIMAHHNKLHDGVANFASRVFTPKHVRDIPQIYTGRAVCGVKYKLKESNY